jgi:polyphosphate glucokinase
MAAKHKNSKQEQEQENGAPKTVPADAPSKILAIDIGGTKVKVLATGETEPRKFESGKRLTPAQMVEQVRELTRDWQYEAISIGFPGLVGEHGPRSEPGNLGSGWVGFDFAAAFGLPVRITNDAAMQALGGYEGGRMLFLGLGTGLGSALIADHVIVPLELGRLMYRDGRPLGEVLGHQGLEVDGKTAWREKVNEVVTMLMGAFVVDHVLLGGGNAKYLKELPPGTRTGHNQNAFRGGFRLWNADIVPTQPVEGGAPSKEAAPWRMI